MSEPVPTSQRPLNGALSGAGALIVAYYAAQYGAPPEIANAAGLAASAFQATVGDWARGVLEAGALPALARLPFMLMARIG